MRFATLLLIAVFSTTILTQLAVKANVAVPKVAVKAAVAAPKVAVKAAVVAPKIAVKASVTPKVSATVAAPKATIKIGVPKVAASAATKGSVKLSLGGGISLGAKAKTSVKATVSAAVDLTGSCPQAANFGFGVVPVAVNKDASFCKGLKATCCNAADMKAYGDSWVARSKSISNFMWNAAKIQTAAMTFMSGLNSQFGIVKTRRLQGLAVKANVAVPKVAVKAAVAAPKVAIKVGVPKVAAAVKVGAPKVSIGLKATAKPVVAKSSVKVTIKLGSVTNEEKPSIWIGSKKGKPEFIKAWNYMYEQQGKRGSFFTYGQDCYKEMMSLKANLACAVCDNTNEKFFKDSLKVQPTDVDDIQNKCAPFLKSFKLVNNVLWYMMKYVDTVAPTDMTAANLGALTNYVAPDVAACFTSAPAAKVTIKAAVKPTAAVAVKVAVPAVKLAVAVPKVAAKVAVKARILQSLTVAAPKVAVKAAVAVPKVAVKAAVTVPKVAVKAAVAVPKVGLKVTVPKVGITVPKVTVKGTVPKLTVKAAAAGAATPTNIVQNNWTNWRGGMSQDPVVDNVTVSTACLASPGMTMMTNGFIFGYKKGSAVNEVEEFRRGLFVWNNALELMYQVAAGETAKASWKAFKGTKGLVAFLKVDPNQAMNATWRAATMPNTMSGKVVVKPAAVTPAKPAAVTPAKPAAVTPAKPAAVTPAAPAKKHRRMQNITPAKPVTPTPAAPVKPVTPTPAAPVKPVTPTPAVKTTAKKVFTQDSAGLTLTDNATFKSDFTLATDLVKGETQTAMEAANLLRVFSVAFFAVFAMLA